MTRNNDSKSNEKVREAMDLLKEAAAEKKVEVSQMMKDLSQEAKHAKDKAVTKAKDVASAVDKSAHKNPWAFIGGAAATGLLIGLFARFFRRRNSGE